MIKVQDFAFNKIPAHMISKAINKMLGAHNADVKTLKKGIIADVMFICVSKMMCGGSYEETAELFASGQIMNVLNCKKLGGDVSWTIEDFLVEQVWTDLGGIGGMKVVAREFLLSICAHAAELPKAQWYKYEYKGARGVLQLKAAAAADDGETGESGGIGGGGIRVSRGGGGGIPHSAHTVHPRGMGDLDPIGMGMLETYKRKLEQVTATLALARPRARSPAHAPARRSPAHALARSRSLAHCASSSISAIAAAAITYAIAAATLSSSIAAAAITSAAVAAAT